MSSTGSGRGEAPIDRLEVDVFTIPTDAPESDGTFQWTSTTMIVVHVHAAGETGLGYTYGAAAVGELVRSELAPLLERRDALAIRARWTEMMQHLRNIGRTGLGSMAVAAVDVALWDLKSRLLGVPLVVLLGSVREGIPVYGSGGFTSYAMEDTARQFERWSDAGIKRFKMKVGRDPDSDDERVGHARAAIGPAAELFVDANGAYDRKQALAFARLFERHGVTWFEEPVSSLDRQGLRMLRDRSPPAMEIAAGEYASSVYDFLLLLEAGAVDVLMPDATRCGGLTGFLDAAALARSFQLPLSAHTAPALHLHLCCAVPEVRHLEYFHDHVRIEAMLLDGVIVPVDGILSPDPAEVGHGLVLKRADAARYKVQE